jgi:hypothetical protein
MAASIDNRGGTTVNAYRFAIILSLCALHASLAHAEEAADVFPENPDPLVGDWSGRWSAEETVDPELHARIIPLGGDRYRIWMGAKWDNRCPPKLDIEVEKTGDGIAFEQNGMRGEVRGTAFTGGRTRGSLTFALEKVTRLSPTLGKQPPAGSVVLFDGTSLDAWMPYKGWELAEDGAMMVTPKGGYLESKQAFTDIELHMEFRTPYMPRARGQQRGNSGVFIQDVYEVQVLDSYALEGYYDDCGALYKLAAPMVNACAPPLQWQTFDIVYRAPRYDANGKLEANGRMTVQHNGVLIHNDQELKWITTWTEAERLGPPPREPGTIRLQAHNDYVQFRNIWVKELD